MIDFKETADLLNLVDRLPNTLTIAGPTHSGKTVLGWELTRRLCEREGVIFSGALTDGLIAHAGAQVDTLITNTAFAEMNMISYRTKEQTPERPHGISSLQDGLSLTMTDSCKVTVNEALQDIHLQPTHTLLANPNMAVITQPPGPENTMKVRYLGKTYELELIVTDEVPREPAPAIVP